MSAERPYDLVLYGATGFTGGLVAEYLATRLADSPLRWAVAGRNAEKLDQLRRKLERIDPHLGELGMISASSDDAESLRAMSAQARVLITTVGPYAQFGEPLVAACIETGTHYLDLTGEPDWWREIIGRYHARAEAREVMVIPCCGFDSIPADLGALFTAAQLPEGQPQTIDAYVRAKGDASGGTWASMIDALAGMHGGRGRGGDRSGGGRSGGGQVGPKIHRVAATGRWAVPMPIIDPQVVRRSAALAGESYGGALRYHHYLSLKSWTQVAGLIGFVGGLYLGTRFKPTRKLLAGIKKQGEGPSEEARAKHWFRLEFVGRGGGAEVRTHVSGGDPGYTETAKMIAEAAITVVEDRDELPLRGGVLTPASALGHALIERLQAAGMEFAVDS